MRVLVDGLAARTGGGTTYLRSLIGAALAADPTLEVTLLCGARQPFAELERGGRTQLLDVLGTAPSAARRAVWQQTGLPRLAAKLRADVIFAPSELGPWRSPVPMLLGFQNPNLYERPVPVGLAQELRLRALLLGARASARRAQGLVFVSEPFRRVAVRALHVSGSRQWTIEPGLDPVFRRADARDQPAAAGDRYLLCVADIYPYKNLVRLVDAFALVARAAGDDLRLMLVGRPFDLRETQRVRERARAHGLEPRVILSGAVPLERMPALYRGAACFAFPSLLESFGFPPLEAMACGVPVACARSSVLPEICGDGAEYFDPHDAADIARVLSSILADERRSAAVAARGRSQAERYSWERAGSRVVEALRACAG